MKIFLGYASEHLDVAKDVYAFLKDTGHEVWFDKDSLIPGVEWDRERSGGQDGADLIVHLVSQEIIERRGVVNREIRQTLRLAEDQPFGALFTVFIRVEDFKLPVELTRFQYVDYFDPDWRDRLRESLDKRGSQLQRGNRGGPVPRKEVVSSELSSSGPTLIEFSDATDRYECKGEYLSYPGQGLYWAMVNSKLQSTALGDFVGMRGELKRLGADEDPPPEDEGPRYTWEQTCEEFFAHGEVVSVRFYQYWYMGGAHPNHHISSLTFLGLEHGLVEIAALFDHEDKVAIKLLDYCKKVILASLGPDDPPDIDSYLGKRDDHWSLLGEYNVDNRGITFNFSPYTLLPYVFGYQEAHVPWSVFWDDLTEEFRSLFEDLTKPRHARVASF